MLFIVKCEPLTSVAQRRMSSDLELAWEITLQRLLTARRFARRHRLRCDNWSTNMHWLQLYIHVSIITFNFAILYIPLVAVIS
jgi:hypothetical protein